MTNLYRNRQSEIAGIILTGIFVYLLSALDVSAQTQTSEIRALPPNQTIEREITGAETHRYKFDLRANEFFQARVEQKGVDVTLKLLDASGNVLAIMDSPNGKEGSETLSSVAAKSGSYTLEITGFDEKAGKGVYTVQRESSRTATTQDKRRVKVERLFVEGMTARDTREQTETVIKKLEEALAGWKELQDVYLTELTAQQVNQLKANIIFGEAEALLDEGTAQSLRAGVAKFQEAGNLYRESGNQKGEAHSLFQAGFISDDLGEKDAALKFYDQALLLFRNLTDNSWEATTLNNIGLVYYSLDKKQKALDYFNQSLLLLKAVGEKANEAMTLNSVAAIYADWGEHQKAFDTLNQALTLARDAKDKFVEARTLNNLGSAYTASSEYQKALESYNQALQIRRVIGDKQGEINTLSNIAKVKELQESQIQPDNPLLPIGKSIERQLNSGNKAHGYRVLLKKGQVLRVDAQEKGVDVSIALFRADDGQIITSTNIGSGFERETLFFIAEQTGDYRVFVVPPGFSLGRNYQLTAEIKEVATGADQERIKAQRLLAEALAIREKGSEEEIRKAIAKYEESLTLWEKLGEKYWEGYTSSFLGVDYFKLGEKKKALDYYTRALSFEKAVGDSYGEARTLSNIGSVFNALGENQEALKYYTQALPLFKIVDSKKDEAIILSKIGSIYLDSRKNQEALKYYAQALPLFKTIGSKIDVAIVLNNMGGAYYFLEAVLKVLVDYVEWKI